MSHSKAPAPAAPSVQYRKATRDDRHAIADFQLAMARETERLELDPPTVALGVAAVFADPGHGIYYVAESAGRVIASLLITYEWSDWRNGHVWWIQSVYVVPGFRGKKVFAGLYRFIQALVKNDQNARGLRLYVDKTNHSAQKIYAKLGMHGEHYDLYEWMKS